MIRKRLSDVLPRDGRAGLDRAWSTTEAAADLKPLPAATYRARVVDGQLFNAKSATPGYKTTLEVIDGEHAGRLLWHDVWLSERALGLAKRDLAKLGIVTLDDLEKPPPPGLIVDARVSLRTTDDGTEYNKVVRFDVVGREVEQADPFAPEFDAESADERGFDWRHGEQRPTPAATAATARERTRPDATERDDDRPDATAGRLPGFEPGADPGRPGAYAEPAKNGKPRTIV